MEAEESEVEINKVSANLHSVERAISAVQNNRLPSDCHYLTFITRYATSYQMTVNTIGIAPGREQLERYLFVDLGVDVMLCLLSFSFRLNFPFATRYKRCGVSFPQALHNSATASIVNTLAEYLRGSFSSRAVSLK